MKIAILVFAACLAAANANFVSTFGAYEKTINDEINKQIGVELKGHYTYLKLSHMFNDKARYYPKVAKYFRAKADEEMQHAERFIQYQNQRGGSFTLSSVVTAGNESPREVQNCDNVDSLLKAFECAQSLEIFVTKALTKLASIASNVEAAANSDGITENALMKGQSVLVTLTDGTVKPLNDLEDRDRGSIQTVQYIELAEMITHEFLGHQIEDTKEIANYFHTLNNFKDDDATQSSAQVEKLGAYLFDKNLQLAEN